MQKGIEKGTDLFYEMQSEQACWLVRCSKIDLSPFSFFAELTYTIDGKTRTVSFGNEAGKIPEVSNGY